jgi:hypothetical protein
MSMSSNPPDRGASKVFLLAAASVLFAGAILGGGGVWLYKQGEINQKNEEIDQLRSNIAASNGQSKLAFRFTKAENFKNPGQTFGPSTPRQPDRYELYITFEIRNNDTEPYPFSPDKDIKVKNATTNATLQSCVLNPQAAGYGDNELTEQVIQAGETVVGYRMYCASNDPEADQKAFSVYFTDNSARSTRSISVAAVVRPLPYASPQ